MKILNLYAGLGGNRKLWEGHEITSVEINTSIAEIYQKQFPQDRLIITDAHQYLLDHYDEYDFVWSSYPCQTHSKARVPLVKLGKVKTAYADLKLYEEILLLKHYFKGKYTVENVKGYYDPLIKPTTSIGRHWIWSNFKIRDLEIKNARSVESITRTTTHHGFNIKNEKTTIRKDQILRNTVNPLIGLHILNEAEKKIKFGEIKQIEIFEA